MKAIPENHINTFSKSNLFFTILSFSNTRLQQKHNFFKLIKSLNVLLLLKKGSYKFNFKSCL